ncbi:MAG TPA: protein-L-isoaspartate O-methyltransferase, partial [Hyphomicrobiales bacterium]|nr:protein-L-isoaspartate O-methyltransferase [Hyphomicrobiales bacterium]
MNFRAARLAMVESQIRPNGVRDPRILDLFARIPREEFVPERQKALAYIDETLTVVPASGGSPPRSLLPPMVLARMLQFAAPASTDRALDIGGITGYSAAILAGLCGKIDALESSEALAAEMSRYLQAAGIADIAVHCGPLEKGWEESAPYDLILLNGAVTREPKDLYAQL